MMDANQTHTQSGTQDMCTEAGSSSSQECCKRNGDPANCETCPVNDSCTQIHDGQTSHRSHRGSLIYDRVPLVAEVNYRCFGYDPPRTSERYRRIFARHRSRGIE